jgi:hypothetical protein
MMKGFNHRFSCHVKQISQRMKKDGDLEVLMVAVKLRIMMDIGDEWGRILADLMDPRVLIEMEELTKSLDKLPFSAAFTGLDVVFATADETLVTLRNAKADRFVFDCQDAGITFYVVAETDGPTIGILSELMNTRVQVDMTGEQALLDLA